MTNATASIRPPTTEERRAVLGVLEAAFEGPFEARLVDALWRADAVTLERAAVIDDEIVGYCAISPVTVSPELKTDGGLFGLAPVAVAPDCQNAGIGALIVETALADLSATLDPTLTVVLGERDYYRRFGFDVASDHGLSWSGGDAGDAFQAMPGAAYDATSPRIVSYHPAFSLFD